jgi:hypothetical protein
MKPLRRLLLVLTGLTGSALAFESDPDWAGPSQHGELIILIDPKVSILMIATCIGILIFQFAFQLLLLYPLH